mgnify:CR=1 FL=1
MPTNFKRPIEYLDGKKAIEKITMMNGYKVELFASEKEFPDKIQKEIEKIKPEKEFEKFKEIEKIKPEKEFPDKFQKELDVPHREYALAVRDYIRTQPDYNPALRGTSATAFNGTDTNFTFYNGINPDPSLAPTAISDKGGGQVVLTLGRAITADDVALPLMMRVANGSTLRRCCARAVRCLARRGNGVCGCAASRGRCGC